MLLKEEGGEQRKSLRAPLGLVRVFVTPGQSRSTQNKEETDTTQRVVDMSTLTVSDGEGSDFVLLKDLKRDITTKSSRAIKKPAELSKGIMSFRE